MVPAHSPMPRSCVVVHASRRLALFPTPCHAPVQCVCMLLRLDSFSHLIGPLVRPHTDDACTLPSSAAGAGDQGRLQLQQLQLVHMQRGNLRGATWGQGAHAPFAWPAGAGMLSLCTLLEEATACACGITGRRGTVGCKLVLGDTAHVPGTLLMSCAPRARCSAALPAPASQVAWNMNGLGWKGYVPPRTRLGPNRPMGGERSEL